MSDETIDTATRPWSCRFSVPAAGRRFVLGDVHGCYRTLRRVVEEVLKLGEGDTLYLLGDYIDRGPDSKGVLDYLLQLWLKTDISIQPLLGNHEKMLLNAVVRGEDY